MTQQKGSLLSASTPAPNPAIKLETEKTGDEVLPDDIQDFSNQKKVAEKTVVRPENSYSVPQSHYFWQTVFVFPVLAAICICLTFGLSLIFFGRREGQQWRDYKTPK